METISALDWNLVSLPEVYGILGLDNLPERLFHAGPKSRRRWGQERALKGQGYTRDVKQDMKHPGHGRVYRVEQSEVRYRSSNNDVISMMSQRSYIVRRNYDCLRVKIQGETTVSLVILCSHNFLV